MGEVGWGSMGWKGGVRNIEHMGMQRWVDRRWGRMRLEIVI